VNISELIGKKLTSIKVKDAEIIFKTNECESFMLYHYNDCCESVYIEDICGDIKDLLGSPIIEAQEITNREEDPLNKQSESWTWTFYKLATVKGWVTIRWIGTSNGYYSESVDFRKVEDG
jgi:hypothetical protein